MLTSYDFAASPSALLFYTALRVSYDIKAHWSGGLTLRQWWLPGSNHATMYGLTARYEPIVSSFGRVFGDAAIGVTSTSYRVVVRLRPGRRLRMGPAGPGRPVARALPSLRAGPQPRFPDEQRRPRLVGRRIVHVPLRPRGGERQVRRAARRSGRALPPLGPRFRSRRHRRRSGPVPQRRAGQTSRPFKPGCPENDEDGDEVPDVDDACPVRCRGPQSEAARLPADRHRQGRHRRSRRPVSAEARAGDVDPAHNGCPEKGKKGAVEEEGAPPPSGESPSAPSTVRKRLGLKK